MSLGQAHQKAFALQTFPLSLAVYQESKGNKGPSQEYYWCTHSVDLEGMSQRYPSCLVGETARETWEEVIDLVTGGL